MVSISMAFALFCVLSTSAQEFSLFYRVPREAKDDETDKTVTDLINWIQNQYTALNRKERGDLSRAYLPQYGSETPELPRPFQSPNDETPSPNGATENSEPLQPVFSAEEPPTVQIPQQQYTTEQPEYSTEPQFPTGSASRPEQDLPDAPQPATPNQFVSEAPEDRPHVHDLQVECAKDSMKINFEFNEPFNGLIYSLDHRSEPSCNYVTPNSGQYRFSFSLQLGVCGTQFVEEGQRSFLEGKIVVQTEPGVLEVWDMVRVVRCLWEKTIPKTISSDLSVSGLASNLSNFSGDNAAAELTVSRGKFPQETAYDRGEVRIGDQMTLIVRALGDTGFGIRIGVCTASDGGNTEKVQLTDDNGCPLRSKLFGGFNFGRDSNGAAIAYSYFKAFRFPENNMVNFHCSVELCKAECSTCANGIGSKKRRRRETRSHLGTISSTIKVYSFY